MLGACSSEKDDVTSTKLNQYDMIEGQSAWLAVGIALPGDADQITRSNEDLDDGLATEYAVKSGKIVLFRGVTEDDAILLKEYSIGTPTFNSENTDQAPAGGTSDGEITSTSQKVVTEIQTPSLGAEDNLYAYVILNDEGNTTGISYTPGMKFSAFKTQVLKAIGITNESDGYGALNETNGLVMTSVPIASAAGGSEAPASGTKVTTLAKVDKTAIYPTKAAATAGTSVACVYVERAAVKVQVTNAVTTITLPGSSSLNCTFNGWALGNTNNSTSGYYNTRQFDEDWMSYTNAKCATPYLKYRMVGRTNFFDSGHTPAYRTYFGSDVNYDGNTGLNNNKIADDKYTLATGAVTYTYENTFNEDCQTFANTTYVGFKVTVEGGDFYTSEGQPNTRLVVADLPGVVKTNSAATIATAMTAIDAAIKADLEAGTGRTISDGVTKVSYTITPVVTLGTRNASTGEISYTWTLKLENLKNQSDADLSPADVSAINSLAATTLDDVHASTVKLYKYVGGVTYYAARIAHFGDAETPWSAPNEAYNDYGKIYPTNGQSIHDTPVIYGANRANAWLGRWGIVRNNWYNVTVSSITGLGSPVPEDFSSNVTPDDNPSPSYFIAAHVHILPWAVRNQSVELK